MAVDAVPSGFDAAPFWALAKDSLLEAYKSAGVVEESLPLHGLGRDGGSWWRWLGAPAGRLQAYFGTEVALYFAWMNHTQKALLVPAAAGLAVYYRRLTLDASIDDDAWVAGGAGTPRRASREPFTTYCIRRRPSTLCWYASGARGSARAGAGPRRS